MEIYSDNGTNFKGPSKELRDAIVYLDSDKQQENGIKNGIK